MPKKELTAMPASDDELRTARAELSRAVSERLRTDTADILSLNEESAGSLLDLYKERSHDYEGQIVAASNVLLLGRRGTGKTSALIRGYIQLWLRDFPCAFYDVQPISRSEKHQITARVLSYFINEVLDMTPDNRTLKKQAEELTRVLTDLSKIRVASFERTESRQVHESASGASAIGAALQATGNVGHVAASGSRRRSKSEDRNLNETVTTEVKTWELLEEVLQTVRSLLSAVCKAMPNRPMFLILDDFYYVNRADQAEILDYLHRAFKGHDCWLKVSGVRHRLKAFRQNGYSVGLQVPHDAQEVSLDLSLDDYQLTKSFLEDILRSLCRPEGLTLSDVLTDNARDRLVLASGGVPRDYLYLFADCLDRHLKAANWERISAETINDRAPALVQQKWQELHEDTAASETGGLIDRLNDIHNFCIKTIDRNVFLVSAEDLVMTDWGKQISALVEFRFLHRVGHTTLKVGGRGYVGMRYTILCLDLPSYAGVRVRSVKQVEFWRSEEVQTIRQKAFVYAPDETLPDLVRAVIKDQATLALDFGRVSET